MKYSFTIIVLALAMSACQKKVEPNLPKYKKTLVGKWKEIYVQNHMGRVKIRFPMTTTYTDSTIIDFYPGSHPMYGKDTSLTYKYKLEREGVYNVYLDHDTVSRKYRFISNDTLILGTVEPDSIVPHNRIYPIFYKIEGEKYDPNDQ